MARIAPSPQRPSWSDLPEEAWARIMGFLPAGTRLKVAALVCSKLNRAAAAATQQVALCPPQAVPDSFERWLANHGHQHISALECLLASYELQLPPNWPNLQSLRLLGASHQTLAGLLPSCPQLTALELGPWAVSSQTLGGALGEATGLQRLRLDRPIVERGDAFLPGTVLQRLTALTQLRFDLKAEKAGREPTLQHISCLVSLQDLEVHTDEASLVLGSIKTPGLSTLTGLTRLCVCQGAFDPTVLSATTQLRVLSLHWGELYLEQDIQDPDDPEPSSIAAEVLISCVGRMPRLQHLMLEPVLLKWPADASAYSALTASSELTMLSLSASRGNNEPALGVWSGMLREGRHWPALQELRFALGPKPYDDDGWDSDDDPDDDQLPRSAFSASELWRLVVCCPGLQACELRVCNGVQLSPLTALEELTRLVVHAPSEATFRSLSALTRLKHLRAEDCARVRPTALVRLTALRALEVLLLQPADELDDDYLHPPESSPLPVYFNQSWQLEEDSARLPVWALLLQHCAGYPECHALLLPGLVQAVIEQQRAMQEQQAHQQLLLNVQAVQLQRQVDDHRSEAAELRGRVAALDGQLAQVLQAVQQQQQ